jgi:hypothetical protein
MSTTEEIEVNVRQIEDTTPTPNPASRCSS